MPTVPISENVQLTHLKSALDLAIEGFNSRCSSGTEKAKQDKFLTTERNHIRNVAKIQACLDVYRQGAATKCSNELIGEKHDSKKLGKFLRSQGKAKPNIAWDAHHLVSGKHASAALARTVLADDDFKVRIDDPDNGCWLPKTREDARGTVFPSATPHQNIHRNLYYDWVFSVIVTSESEMDLRAKLRLIATRLQRGTIPPNILAKAPIKRCS